MMMQDPMKINDRFTITERVCATTNDNEHLLILKINDKELRKTIWAIGDDQVCAIAHEDFVRNCNFNYNDVCIKEIPYKTNSPDSIGEWKPLIEVLVKDTLSKYMEHNGLVHVYPQWLPDDLHADMDECTFEQLLPDLDHIILYDDNTMEMVADKVITRNETPSLD